MKVAILLAVLEGSAIYVLLAKSSSQKLMEDETSSKDVAESLFLPSPKRIIGAVTIADANNIITTDAIHPWRSRLMLMGGDDDDDKAVELGSLLWVVNCCPFKQAIVSTVT